MASLFPHKCRLLTLSIVLSGLLLGCAPQGGSEPLKEATLSFSGSAVPSLSAVAGSEVVLPVPEEEGRLFGGWFFDPSFYERAPETLLLERDTVLYAYWGSGTLSFAVNFYVDGTYYSSRRVDYGGALLSDDFPSFEPREGYVGVWENQSGLAGILSNVRVDGTYLEEGSVRRLFFDSRLGTEVKSQIVEAGEAPERPEDPFRDGFYFAGWSLSPTAYEPFSFDEPLLADTVLYAFWSEEPPLQEDGTVIAFDYPRLVGDYNGWNFFDRESLFRPLAGQCGLFFEPRCDGYLAVVYAIVYVSSEGRWEIEEGYNLEGERIVGASNFSYVRKLAPGEDSFTLSYYLTKPLVFSLIVRSGVTTRPLSSEVGPYEEGDACEVSFLSEANVFLPPFFVDRGDPLPELPCPESEGRSFIGWSRDREGKKMVAPGLRVEGPLVLYGQWEEAFLLRFDSRGGSDVPSLTVSRSDPYPAMPPFPERDGYAFLGWYASPSLNEPFDFRKALTSDAVCYAKWAKEESGEPVRFSFLDPEGAELAPSYEGLSGELPLKPGYAPRKDGSYFDGWYVDPGLTLRADFLFEEEAYASRSLYASFLPLPTDDYVLYYENSGRDPETGTEIAGFRAHYGAGADVLSGGENNHPGASFLGWYDQEEGGNRLEDFPLGRNGEIVSIYAHWEEKE